MLIPEEYEKGMPARKIWDQRIGCAYLHTISKYGYPPNPENSISYIAEMTALGFRSIELEGIGTDNIRYMFYQKEKIAEALRDLKCTLPVYCVVLPELSSVMPEKRIAALEAFETGCRTAQFLGAAAVLDNGPLLPLAYPENQPVLRHYNEVVLRQLQLPLGFDWSVYYAELIKTYEHACRIASRHGLQFLLHPCEGSLITGTDSFALFAAQLNCDNLLFNLDTANQFYMKDHLALSMHRLKGKIGYIHLSDNRGCQVEHLEPGAGMVDWGTFFTAMAATGFNGYIAIDIGGAESGIDKIDEAYLRTAAWLSGQLEKYGLLWSEKRSSSHLL